MKTMNKICGYTLFIIGIVKAIIAFIAIVEFLQTVSSILSGGSSTSLYMMYMMVPFSEFLGWVQIFMAALSIIMIIVNLNNGYMKIASGYLYGIGAILMESLLPSFIMIFAVFCECTMYIKAGSKIINNNNLNENNGAFNFNSGYNKKTKVNRAEQKKIMNETDWFYSEGNKETKSNYVVNEKDWLNAEEEKVESQNGIINETSWFYSEGERKSEIKRQNRRIKLQKEIEEWKQLLDSGEIDEKTYNEETNKLIEKERKKSEKEYRR